MNENRSQHDEDAVPDWWLYLMMVLFGPITFIDALRADFHTSRGQLLAGLLGTFLWFTVAMEVMAYV